MNHSTLAQCDSATRSNLFFVTIFLFGIPSQDGPALLLVGRKGPFLLIDIPEVAGQFFPFFPRSLPMPLLFSFFFFDFLSL